MFLPRDQRAQPVQARANQREHRFRFSTKYRKAESRLVYYGHRYYSPKLGRWVSRDPIWERGGGLLYAFVANDPVSCADILGLIIQFLEPDLAGYKPEQHDDIVQNSQNLEAKVRDIIAQKAGSEDLQKVLKCLYESQDVTITVQMKFTHSQGSVPHDPKYPKPPTVPVTVSGHAVDTTHTFVHEIIHVLEILVVKDAEREDPCACLNDPSVKKILDALKAMRNKPHEAGGSDDVYRGLSPADFFSSVLLQEKGTEGLGLDWPSMKKYVHW